jgi:hypothetical protein
MNNKVIYFTETRGNLKGHVFSYTFIDDWSDAKIETKLNDLRKEGYQGLTVGSYEEFDKASKEASIKIYKAYEAQNSDAETFNTMLNILPPRNHSKVDGAEIFRVSEELDAGLFDFFIRISEQYFKVVAHRTANTRDLVALCYNAKAA